MILHNSRMIGFFKMCYITCRTAYGRVSTLIELASTDLEGSDPLHGQQYILHYVNCLYKMCTNTVSGMWWLVHLYRQLL